MTEVKEKVLLLSLAGVSTAEVAKRLDLGKRSIQKHKQDLRKMGHKLPLEVEGPGLRPGILKR